MRRKLEKQSLTKSNGLKSFSDDKGDEIVVEGEETADLTRHGSKLRRSRRINGGGEGAESALLADDSSARASKRPRLIWTPQLHKRFVDSVAHLGVKNADPKTILQLMAIEGLTRGNVASHLQKYRSYLKRMEVLDSSSTLYDDLTVKPQNR